jgi:hypothetical protein
MNKTYCGYCGFEKTPINLCCCGGRCFDFEQSKKDIKGSKMTETEKETQLKRLDRLWLG